MKPIRTILTLALTSALSLATASAQMDEITIRVLDAGEAGEQTLMQRIPLPDPDEAGTRSRHRERVQPEQGAGEQHREMREHTLEHREAVREQAREGKETVREGAGVR
jgi:hypothetical protein